MERFGEDIAIDPALDGLSGLAKIAGHRSHRRYAPRPVDAELLRLLCACALSAPSKSDLQQGDIVVVRDAAIRKGIVATIPDMPWIEDAPVFLVFVGNGQRLPMMARLHDKPFPNDHLDQFFNAAVDGAIVMSTFMCAAAAVGLGFCPISAIRDHPQVVSELLRLPDRVFPSPGFASAGRRKRAKLRRVCRSNRPSSRTPTVNATSPAKSTLTIGAARHCDPIGANAMSAVGAKRRSTAGPRIKRGNMPSRRARISARFVRGKGFCLD